MAQVDLFSNLTKKGGDFEAFQKAGIITMGQYNNLLTDALEREGNIYETKKKMLQSDTKSLNILKKIKEVSTKLFEGQKTARDMQKSVYKQEEAIEVLKRKGSKSINADEKKLYAQIIKRKEVELVNNRLILDQTRRTIPLLGGMGKTGALISDSMVDVLGAVGGIVPIIGGLISSIIKLGAVIGGMLLYPITKGFETFLKMQGIVGNLAADIGLTNRESHGLLDNFASLTIEATKFGGSMEDVAAIVNTFSNTTGKNRIFSKEEIGSLVELGLGTGLGVKGAAELASSFDNIGISLEHTIKLTDRARDMAARYNVNTTKVLTTYNSLVQSLTGIGFGKGLENLGKLAAKAEAIRFDLASSVSSFTDAFFDPEKAVDASAQMQVLGGKFAASFGDPISLAFESMNDPTALAEKFADALKGITRKDKNGDFFIPAESRKQLQIASQTLGQNYEKAEASAIEQAKVADKMTALARAGVNLFNIKDEDKPALASLMNLNKGKYEISLPDGTKKLLSELTDKDQMASILDDRKRNESAAIDRKTLVEKFGLIADRFILGFSTVFVKLNSVLSNSKLMETIEGFGTSLAEKVIPLISNIFSDGGSIKKILDNVVDKVSNIVTTVSGILNGSESFWNKIKDGMVTFVKGVWDLIFPYLKAGFGEILLSLGKATDSDTIKVWGEKMLLETSQQNKTINGLMDSKEKEKMLDHINDNRTSLSMKQTAGVVGAGAVGGLALGVTGGALAGAEFGTAAGSIVPVIGNIVGAILGAAAGATLAWIGEKGYNSLTAEKFDPNQQNIPVTNVKDALITSHGIIKGDKGDMWAAFQQPVGGDGSSTNNSSTDRVEHSGTIILKSEDGKVVTWEQMYHARDLIGGRIASINNGYSGGFGNYQDANISPIKPLM